MRIPQVGLIPQDGVNKATAERSPTNSMHPAYRVATTATPTGALNYSNNAVNVTISSQARALGKLKAIAAVLITLPMLLSSTNAKADNDWDHMGTTFAIQMLTYGISKQILGLGYHQECGEYVNSECSYPYGRAKVYHRTEVVLFSAVLTAVGTFAYSYVKTLHGAPIPYREIGMNAIGQAAAIGAIYVFKF